jgi:uncharacterized protein (TIGR00369 family)
VAGRLWEGSRDRPRPRALDTLGYELLALDAEAGTAETSFTVGEEFGNTVGNVQGGFLAAMLDATLGTAIVSTLDPGEVAPTVELKVSYLRPAEIGRVVGRGRILKRGSRVAFLTGELYDADDRVLATASGTFLLTPASDTENPGR